MQNQLLTKLLETSIALNIEEERYRRKGNYKHVNKIIPQLDNLYAQIIGFGKDGINALYPLLTHESPYVSFWAAVGLLPHKTTKALGVIRELQKQKKLIFGDAEMVLDLWSKGELKFPKPIIQEKSQK